MLSNEKIVSRLFIRLTIQTDSLGMLKVQKIEFLCVTNVYKLNVGIFVLIILCNFCDFTWFFTILANKNGKFFAWWAIFYQLIHMVFESIRSFGTNNNNGYFFVDFFILKKYWRYKQFTIVLDKLAIFILYKYITNRTRKIISSLYCLRQ